ncbi:hypothetical protein [Paenibacillus arenosi]|uniref:DUF2157 domain-containing protein n=1 Tax=Paenibacillus arenosi TaxID=2774142 RepID=A0ABR9ATW6_9BACL|nr:hypothetical protein [Paenibacillus arenosi]MBD8497550.1 hypothetical protein [Paenibacillus arenosi]
MENNHGTNENAKNTNTVIEKQLEQELTPFLQSYVASPPKQEETDRLIAALRPHFKMALQRDSEDVILSANNNDDLFANLQPTTTKRLSLLHLLRLQCYVYHTKFFIATAAMFILLLFVAGSNEIRASWLWELFPWTIPAYMGAGLLYSFRSSNDGMRKLEMVTPYPPQLQFMVRLFLMYAISLVLGLGGSLSAYLSGEQLSLMLFILNWLAPATLVMGMLIAIQYRKGMQSAYRWSGSAWLLYMLMNELSIMKVNTTLHLLQNGIALTIGIILAVGSVAKIIRTGGYGRKVTSL